MTDVDAIAGTENGSFDGGCHCGAVRFTVQGPLWQILICHCSDCRNLAGNSWASTAVADGNCRMIKSEALKWYKSSSWATRGFCGECGAQMFYKVNDGSEFSVAAGMLDEELGLRAAGQIFAGSLPEWCHPDGSLPHLDDQLLEAYQDGTPEKP